MIPKTNKRLLTERDARIKQQERDRILAAAEQLAESAVDGEAVWTLREAYAEFIKHLREAVK